MTRKYRGNMLAALAPLQIILICSLVDHIGLWIVPITCGIFTASLLWYVGLDALKELHLG
ncbi:MAG: hypothetical protein ABRQ26_07505 [Syntrophomonadaceae bacterium]